MLTKSLQTKLVGAYRKHFGRSLVSIVLFGSRARGDAKPTSDYDMFMVIEGLPARPLMRMRAVRAPLGGFGEHFSIIAKTSQEVLSHFPSLYLDLGLDGRILYDTGFFKERLSLIRKLIKQSGLSRHAIDHEFYWKWDRPPGSHWRLDWSGYYVLKG